MYEGNATVWDLSITTTTRTLYCLAHRATKARYSRFTLRMSNSKASITDSASLTLGLTDLSHGGVIEICFVFPHRRRLSEVTVKDGFVKQVVFLPQQSPILALMGYLDPDVFGPMLSMQLWSVVSDAFPLAFTEFFCLRHNLKPAGDGVRRGTIVKPEHSLIYYGFGPTYEFEVLLWTWRTGGVHKGLETSRYLNRLDVLKELFNVFINRAVSHPMLS